MQKSIARITLNLHSDSVSDTLKLLFKQSTALYCRTAVGAAVFAFLGSSKGLLLLLLYLGVLY